MLGISKPSWFGYFEYTYFLTLSSTTTFVAEKIYQNVFYDL